MPPKYQATFYNMGTNYPKWSPVAQEKVDQAFNMIDPASPAGLVLNGKDGNKLVFLRDAQFHQGSDANQLEHWNFVIRTLGQGSVDSAEMHLYPDGNYTAPGGNNTYKTFKGNGAGKVVPEKEVQSVPVVNDSNFPKLGK